MSSCDINWRNVIGFEDCYQISEYGDLRNIKTGKMLAISLAGAGYVKADLWKNGKNTQTLRHRLVAQAFIGDISGKEINHKDGNKQNNHVSNLEIVTRSENEQHSRKVLGNLCKPIFSINHDTFEVKQYPSIVEAEKDGFIPASIYQCIYGQQKLHKNHYFYFVDNAHANNKRGNKAHPAKQLSDDEIWEIVNETHQGLSPFEDTFRFARAIEAKIRGE